MSVEELVVKLRSYNPGVSTSLICDAWAFAESAHRGQFRDSGDMFLRHPVEVARILAELELDVVTVASGLLHDVLEDTMVTRQELERSFGSEIARLVDGVTKLSKLRFQTREEQQAENLRKMFLAMAEDVRVILIKLADRLHNMRTLHHLPDERQRKIAQETLEIYTPIAHRLGVWALKWEMEDLALRSLEPEAYQDLVVRIAKKRQEREGELDEVMADLRGKLEELSLRSEIQGRPKHFYSIYHKMHDQGKELDEIYDLMAVRVIVESVKDCYGVLGIVHSLWKPVPGRFKDYVAMPKSNMYQSLHTTVIGPKGEPLEIQIRTREMHRIAEKGIAAHWLYKEGDKTSQEFEQKVAWLRQVMEWLKEAKDPKEFMETLRIDLFEDEVFVFTPKGDVKSLPAGSTPIDFAFSVHTDIGLRCVGAKVNGRMVSLEYQLKNGEIVEILTSKNASPSQDWLSFVKTSKARSKVRAWRKEEHRDESIQKGRDLLEKEAGKLGLQPQDVFRSEKLAVPVQRFGFQNQDDLFASIGFGKVTAAQVLSRLLGREEFEARKRQFKLEQRRAEGRRPGPSTQSVRIKGIDNLLVRYAKCCSPVPGDEIVGYITRGRGVSIHRADCPSLAHLNGEASRRIEAEWDSSSGGYFPVEIEVEAFDRVNLLANIMNTVSDGRTNIEAVNARTIPGKLAFVNLVVDINDVAHMREIINRLKQVNGVLGVHRGRNG